MARARQSGFNNGTLSLSHRMEAVMISRAHHQFAEPVSRGYGRAGGYALIFIIAVLLILALMSNPVLPQWQAGLA